MIFPSNRLPKPIPLNSSMKSRGLNLSAILCVFLTLCFNSSSFSASPRPPVPVSPASSLILHPSSFPQVGHGDSRIHIIPTLSSRSVKNGGKLTISAVIKAVAGVREVKAELRDDTHAIDTLTLTPTQSAGFPGSAGILPASSSGPLPSTTSLWSGV